MNAILQMKAAFETAFPPAYRFVRRRLPRGVLFNVIYHSNYWGNASSRSGPGSDLESTNVMRSELPKVLESIGATSLLDAACGDFYWMSRIDLPIQQYIGVDIVPPLIRQNQAKFGSASRRFVSLDICKDQLPRADAILAREVLVHLSMTDTMAALRNFKRSGATYLLATTHHNLDANRDIATCQWRAVNFRLAPFNFPEPLLLIDEQRPLEAGGMSLGVWRLDSLPIPEVDAAVQSPRVAVGSAAD